MGQASDWEPLPPERLEDAPGAGAGADEGFTPPSTPPDTAAAAAASARAELALQALRERIASTPTSEALGATLEHEDRKRRRRRRAAGVERLAACATMASTIRPDEVPLAVEYDGGGEGRDLREDEAWFRALPASERQRLHELWSSARRRAQGSDRPDLRKVGAAMARGAAVAFVVGLLLCAVGGGLAAAGLLALLGAVGVGVAQCAGGGRQTCALAGIVVFPIVYGLALLTNPILLLGWMLMAYGFGVLGMTAEMCRAGGFDVRQDAASRASLSSAAARREPE